MLEVRDDRLAVTAPGESFVSIKAWMAAHPLLTIVVVVGLSGARAYFLYKQWRGRKPIGIAAHAAESHGKIESAATPSVWRRTRNGAVVGLMFPGIFTLLLVGVYLFGGRYQRDYDSTIDMLVLSIAYPLGSAIMGGVIGFGAPFMTNFARGTLVGTAAMLPFMIGIGLSMSNGLAHWDMPWTLVTASLSVMLGAGLAIGVLRGRAREASGGRVR